MSLRDETNRLGLRTKESSRKPNSPITKHGLEKILKNRFYIGEFVWGKKIYTGSHPPLISRELFEQVQRRLAENCHGTKVRGRRRFAFSSFLKCGFCNCSIVGEVQKERYVYYRCSFAKGRCAQPYYKELQIDKIFEEAIGNLYIDKPIAAEVKKQLRKSHEDHEVILERQLTLLKNDMEKKNYLLRKAWEHVAEDLISKDEYKARRNEIQSDLARIQAEIGRLNRRNIEYKEHGIDVLELLKGFKKIYLSQDLVGKARILDVVLDKCYLKGDSTRFLWKSPFDVLFLMGQLVIKHEKWGE